MELAQQKMLCVALYIKSKYGCYFCEEECPQCLQFHHINADTKSDGVAELCCKKNKPEFFEEINKCVIVCSNCHLKLHYSILFLDKNVVSCQEKMEDYCYTKGKIWYWKDEFEFFKTRKRINNVGPLGRAPNLTV